MPLCTKEFERRVKNLEPEEELIEWRKYLNQYPNSAFRQRIEREWICWKKICSMRIFWRVSNQDTANEDGLEEIYFAQPMYLENIDPRTKTRFAFALGLPGYFNLLVDHKHQINRDLSVHGGIRQRYTGWNLELGGKYSFIKSKRTNTLLTGIMDLRFNASPGFPALRPQIAYGRRFELPNDFQLDAQAQIGSDLVIWNGLDPRLIGGVNVTFVPSPNVRVYFEGSVYMKDFRVKSDNAIPIDPFAFNTLTFGLNSLIAENQIQNPTIVRLVWVPMFPINTSTTGTILVQLWEMFNFIIWTQSSERYLGLLIISLVKMISMNHGNS